MILEKKSACQVCESWRLGLERAELGFKFKARGLGDFALGCLVLVADAAYDRNKNIRGDIGCRSDLASGCNSREERTSNSDSRFTVKLSVLTLDTIFSLLIPNRLNAIVECKYNHSVPVSMLKCSCRMLFILFQAVTSFVIPFSTAGHVFLNYCTLIVCMFSRCHNPPK